MLRSRLSLSSRLAHSSSAPLAPRSRPVHARTMASLPSPARVSELEQNYSMIASQVHAASLSSGPPARLVAVSKVKPAEDILALYVAGVRHFGENYPQELADKAKILPSDIEWHFIGALQSNKCKLLASIPNLYAIETLSSSKSATLLSKSLPSTRTTPLNIFIQINTSAEESKSGLLPLSTPPQATDELFTLALHIIEQCPGLRVKGLMTIGSVASSSLEPGATNPDFEVLIRDRAGLFSILEAKSQSSEGSERLKVAVEEMRSQGLELSMGMSGDFEKAIKQGSTNVRVGSSIFGARPPR